MAHTVGVEYQQPAHAFLAKAPQTKDLPELHRQVALPGARRAVHLDALEQFHGRGLSPNEIVAEINAVTDKALAPQLERFAAWRDGELADRLDRARRREARRVQLLSARAAEIESKLDKEFG